MPRAANNSFNRPGKKCFLASAPLQRRRPVKLAFDAIEAIKEPHGSQEETPARSSA